MITDSGTMRKTIDSAGKAMLMQKAVNNCKRSLSFYASATESRGYIKLFSDAISEFKKDKLRLKICAMPLKIPQNICFQ